MNNQTGYNIPQVLTKTNNLLDHNSQEFWLHTIYVTCFTLSLLALAFIIIVLLRRHFGLTKSENETSLREKYQQYFAQLSSGIYENELLNMLDTSSEHVLALSKRDFTKKTNRKLLLKELLNLHKNLKGREASRLREIYLSLGFKQEHLNELKSISWQKRTLAIQALSQMDIKDAYQAIFNCLEDKHTSVYHEALRAKIRLDVGGFKFITKIQHLSLWKQHQLFCGIQHLSPLDLPSLSCLLNDPKPGQINFALTLIDHFNLAIHKPKVESLLSHPEKKIVLNCLKTLKNIGDIDSIPFMLDLLKQHDGKIGSAILDTVYIIQESLEEKTLIDCLLSEHHHMSLTAAKILASSPYGNRILDNQKSRSKALKQRINQARDNRHK